ncbi:MAG: hypothetical protein MJE77_01295 [Proteobacteria bacterium]|nr:hypothetical protein [Pseudomonadota bacterium]
MKNKHKSQKRKEARRARRKQRHNRPVPQKRARLDEGDAPVVETWATRRTIRQVSGQCTVVVATAIAGIHQLGVVRSDLFAGGHQDVDGYRVPTREAFNSFLARMRESPEKFQPHAEPVSTLEASLLAWGGYAYGLSRGTLSDGARSALRELPDLPGLPGLAALSRPRWLAASRAGAGNQQAIAESVQQFLLDYGDQQVAVADALSALHGTGGLPDAEEVHGRVKIRFELSIERPLGLFATLDRLIGEFPMDQRGYAWRPALDDPLTPPMPALARLNIGSGGSATVMCISSPVAAALTARLEELTSGGLAVTRCQWQVPNLDPFSVAGNFEEPLIVTP